jgi:hypothetical protein
MTLQEVFEAVLVEINKVKAPSLLLSDFNYFANKSVTLYVNKGYNNFEINQQSNDDLRALKTTRVFEYNTELKRQVDDYPAHHLHQNTYVAILPDDYLHLLNCVVEFDDTGSKCSNGYGTQVNAARITSDQYSTALTNYYMQPSWKKPYYFINKLPSAIQTEHEGDVKYRGDINRLELRLGKSTQIPSRIYVDYLQEPERLLLTQEQLDSPTDISQTMQFPNYVCLEIVNQITSLVLENASDPRLNTQMPVSTSIAPAGARMVGK